MKHDPLDEDLAGYVLKALDDETEAQVDTPLQADEEARWPLAYRHAVETLAADQEPSPPPDGLAVRTIARVAEFCCLDLSRAPQAVSRSAPPRSWWRRADLLVAASIMLMALGLGLPALSRMRAGQALIECENNLRVFSDALHAYRDQNGKFPSVRDVRPRDAAGMVVPILAKAGVLRDLSHVRCPGSDPGVTCALDLDQANLLSPEELFRQASSLFPGYAYSLGYKDERENYFGPMVPEDGQASDFPLLADSPPMDGGPGNSTNHGGDGQFVLFADGHVRFVTLRTVGFQKDDIYRNKADKVAAGLDPCDTVLGASAAKP